MLKNFLNKINLLDDLPRGGGGGGNGIIQNIEGKHPEQGAFYTI